MLSILCCIVLILQENQRVNLLLNGLLHFTNVPNGRCGVEVPAETADYNQSVFCFWSPALERTDINQSFAAFDGSAFSNHTALQDGIQSMLERKDLAEAEMAFDHLLEDIPVSLGQNERVGLLGGNQRKNNKG